MSFEVRSIAVFERQAKRLLKKYPSLKDELIALAAALRQAPDQGVAIGKGCFKIRLAIASKGKGRSGGARVLTHVMVSGRVVYLLSIYDKSEVGNLSDKEIAELLSYLPH